MFKRATLMITVALMLTGACSGQQYAQRSSSVDDRLQLRQSSFQAAMSARDADRVASHFAESALVHIADQPALRGRSAIHQFYETVFRFLEASEAEAEITRVSASADMAYSAGRVNNRFRGQNGGVEYAGKYLLVWEKHGDEWWIAAYTISSDQPSGR